MMKNKRILVIAAHPDDEVLGCGGMVSRYSKENEINLLLMGAGLNARKPKGEEDTEEAFKVHLGNSKKAANILGFHKVEYLHFPDNRFDSVPILDIVHSVEQMIGKFNPEIIFTHSNTDLNVDHRMTFQAVLTATRPFLKNRVRELYSFEVLSSTEWAYGMVERDFHPGFYVDISEYIEMKKKAMMVYESEVNPYPHPRSEEAIEAYAKKHGCAAGCCYAEAFEVIRILR